MVTGFSRVRYLIMILLYISAAVLKGQNNQLVLSDLGDRQVYLKGFTLKTDKEIRITAKGAGGSKVIKKTTNFQTDPQNMFAYAWIINARNRELVWRMTVNNTESDWWNKWLRIFDHPVQLDKGEYELYYSNVEPSYYPDEGFITPGKIWDKITGGEDWWEGQADEWGITLESVDEVIDRRDVEKYQQAVKSSAIIDLTEIGDAVRRREGFSLLENARFRIRAIGEGFQGKMYDYGYIVDSRTQERIWEMEYNLTEHAGGAIKNRIIETELSLDAGDYMVYYQSDDNHSFREWNANPPYDPSFWGIMLSAADRDFDRSLVTTFSDRNGSLVVELDKLGDEEHVSQGFTVLKPMKLRIYAVGEGRRGEMFDYGWIQEARSGKQVWIMEYRETDEAGGAQKNRLYDGVVYFEPGSYVVHFVTDDSHSYRDWNSPKPYQPEAWGIRIYTVGRDGDENFIKPYDPEQDKNILVQLTRVGDDEHLRKSFTLEKDTDIRIYAIGEGDWDEMYDFGWIEDFNTGQIVWQMKYRDTRRAGGDDMNRVYDGTLRLPAGTYIAHYQSDDSHSYGDWNKDAPRDRTNWGITIYTY